MKTSKMTTKRQGKYASWTVGLTKKGTALLEVAGKMWVEDFDVIPGIVQVSGNYLTAPQADVPVIGNVWVKFGQICSGMSVCTGPEWPTPKQVHEHFEAQK